MSTNREIKENVIALLNTLPVCNSNSSGTQWVVRCPYCGDSLNPTHGHFSIAINVDSDEPMLYNCFKCPAGGLITPEVLEDLQLGFHGELYGSIKRMNRKLSNHGKKFSMDNKNYVVPIFSNTKENLEKLQYIKRRIGVNLTFESAQKIKIILDIFEFMKYNDIEVIPGISWKKLAFINYNYVGFLSSNNNIITWRCIRDQPSYNRYEKMTLDPKNFSQNTFYAIPNSLDLMYTDEIHIHLAEGTFDILSVFFNLENQNLDHHYYYAACGFGMQSVIRYLTYLGFNTGLTYDIYSDLDKSDRAHAKYLNSIENKIWLDRVIIHRNLQPGEKDFGVSMANIIDGTKPFKLGKC